MEAGDTVARNAGERNRIEGRLRAPRWGWIIYLLSFTRGSLWSPRAIGVGPVGAGGGNPGKPGALWGERFARLKSAGKIWGAIGGGVGRCCAIAWGFCLERTMGALRFVR